MSNTASTLLQKVKEAIKLRSREPESYKASFTNPNSFITATIMGKQEFIPIALLCKNNDRYETLLELYEVFGEPSANEELTDRLKNFYEEHDIEWPNNFYGSITYYIKPVPVKSIVPFFKGSAIEKLSTYAGTRYKASDAFLKDLGNTYAAEIVDKTNKWLNSLSIPDGYIIEPERYWQVAGRFKSFTWGKIYREEFKTQKIFFSVGVDVQNKTLVIKLDGLRSGTHKLSNFEIRDFDYLTQNENLSIQYPLDKIEKLDLETLTFITNRFINLNIDIYERAINLIWNSKADTNNFNNLLLRVNQKYSSNKAATLEKLNDDVLTNLVIDYEKYVLSHAGKEALLNSIEIIKKGNLQIIKSFETDGKPKSILIEVTTGGTRSTLEMTREEIEYLGDNMHTFMYHIIEYNIENNCGKLVIRKGSPTKYAELKSIRYEVNIN